MESNASVFLVPDGTTVFGSDNCASLTLASKTKVNHDSYIFSFTLPPGKTFGLPLGSHCKFFATINGKTVGRSYTPISDVQQTGTADFVIKIYRPTDEFPEGGKMT